MIATTAHLMRHPPLITGYATLPTATLTPQTIAADRPRSVVELAEALLAWVEEVTPPEGKEGVAGVYHRHAAAQYRLVAQRLAEAWADLKVHAADAAARLSSSRAGEAWLSEGDVDEVLGEMGALLRRYVPQDDRGEKGAGR